MHTVTIEGVIIVSESHLLMYQAIKTSKLTENCQYFVMWRLTGKDQRTKVARQLDARSKGFLRPYGSVSAAGGKNGRLMSFFLK